MILMPVYRSFGIIDFGGTGFNGSWLGSRMVCTVQTGH